MQVIYFIFNKKLNKAINSGTIDQVVINYYQHGFDRQLNILNKIQCFLS